MAKRITARDNPFREAPGTADPVLVKSHIQRANHHFDAPERSTSLRIFRQGYPFFETSSGNDGEPAFRVGLNFVSFQGTPGRLIRLLRSDVWLGRVNFGGDSTLWPRPFVTAGAAGMFFVPPVRTRKPFPDPSSLLESA